jgi:para-nitrobenzyl esterase
MLQGPISRIFKILSIAAGAILVAVFCTPPIAFASPTIVIDQGSLVGDSSVPGETQYLGIPFAAPPVGNLRWQPPQLPAHFNGVFQATSFGNTCIQGSGFIFGAEDCLYLNVYVPTVTPPKHGFPVIVWIHAGGLVSWDASWTDPTPLVVGGNVIVVTINYRLGYLGFFAHPAIDAEDHLKANYGLMDQQFALKWVRRNIEAFGGDHRRVTIAGESSGGNSVLAHLASPTAEGLFQRGISQSGGSVHFLKYLDAVSIVPLKTAESVGTPLVPSGLAIAATIGCPGTNAQTAQCLRSLTPDSLVAVQPPSANNLTPGVGILFPIIDGTLLTQTLDAAFKSGSINSVPLINGTNHDEWRLFIPFAYDFFGNPLTDAAYPNAVLAFLSSYNPGITASDPLVQAALGTYPLSAYPTPLAYTDASPSLGLGALATDDLFACPALSADRELVKDLPAIYTYEFNETGSPLPGFSGLSFPIGASHLADVPYMLDLSPIGLQPSFTADEQTLSNTMIHYWAQFAATGNPNFAGAPNWPAYVGRKGSFQSLIAPTPTTETDASFDNDHKCSSFWNEVGDGQD